MEHELKTWMPYFGEVLVGHKTFEVRKNDRDFQVGDTLILREWADDKKEYTGRKLARRVTYILNGGEFGIQGEFCVMSIVKLC